MSAKPKSEICDKCAVINNKVRCSLCKHVTKEWIFSDDGTCIVGDMDLFKGGDGNGRLSETS